MTEDVQAERWALLPQLGSAVVKREARSVREVLQTQLFAAPHLLLSVPRAGGGAAGLRRDPGISNYFI